MCNSVPKTIICLILIASVNLHQKLLISITNSISDRIANLSPPFCSLSAQVTTSPCSWYQLWARAVAFRMQANFAGISSYSLPPSPSSSVHYSSCSRSFCHSSCCTASTGIGYIAGLKTPPDKVRTHSGPLSMLSSAGSDISLANMQYCRNYYRTACRSHIDNARMRAHCTLESRKTF